jgi:hypothetical protein
MILNLVLVVNCRILSEHKFGAVLLKSPKVLGVTSEKK